MSAKRCKTWTVCVVDRGADRHYVMLKAGSPVRGFIVLEHADETIATLAMHGGSYGLANGMRVPHKGTLALQRLYLQDLARNAEIRRDRGRAA